MAKPRRRTAGSKPAPAPAPIATNPETKEAKPKTEGSSTVKYELNPTAKEYRPKAIQNRESWARIKKLLDKGPATEAQLHKALQYGDEFVNSLEKDDKERWPAKFKDSHERFLGYMQKGKDPTKHYIRKVK